MPAPGPTHPKVALLERDTRVRRGVTPRALDGNTPEDGQSLMNRDEFLFAAGRGIRFYYRRGEGVVLECPDDADPRNIDLWLKGTIHAAVATMNGLFPLHASAIAHEGRVHAFTGPSGAGKSTLVAALGQSGFAHFCDDTLLLDTSGGGPPICLPGHKRLKLWPEGAALAGVDCGELVADDYEKHFWDPAGAASEPLPLAELVALAPGDQPTFEPLSAAERIDLLDDDHNTAVLWQSAQRQNRLQRFAHLATLSGRIAMARFARPFDPARFGEGLAAAASHIRNFPA